MLIRFNSKIKIKIKWKLQHFLFSTLKHLTLLISDAAFDDDNLKIEGYSIVRSDHLSNSRRVDVCIYYKQPLALKTLDIKYLQECIVFQVLIANKLCNFISLYWSPSQLTDISDQSTDNLELTLDELASHNPFLIVISSDFDIK